ncbi:hypothetical protein EJC47_00725 [Sphingomonas sp. TF3]|uniref:hypothetical protein n=1 Tax=Sphingomonas sp. TF3 TaxID=2495580 RepID=UPI000F876D7A|nr:hypothetical protein [Sphingomonas sp. TF3]RUN78433.1 hypothetical protein EJC47_00725 [Sphingomonas sp. TF3]
MSRITITENGVEKVVTDIAPHRAERESVLAELSAIYADFEKGTLSALDTREAEIVDLVNRHNELTNLVERFDKASVRRANILAGWEIVKQNRAEGSE